MDNVDGEDPREREWWCITYHRTQYVLLNEYLFSLKDKPTKSLNGCFFFRSVFHLSIFIYISKIYLKFGLSFSINIIQKLNFKEKKSYIKKAFHRGCRDGSAVKSIWCSCREPQFNSQYPWHVAHTANNSSPRVANDSFLPFQAPKHLNALTQTYT